MKNKNYGILVIYKKIDLGEDIYDYYCDGLTRKKARKTVHCQNKYFRNKNVSTRLYTFCEKENVS